MTTEASSPTVYSLEGKRVWVAGHNGMVGSAIVRRLASENCKILTVDHRDLDLTRLDKVHSWMETNRPDAVFVAAARVGGIMANQTLPVQFLHDNLMISNSIIEGAYESKVSKLLFLGYPRLAPQPIVEDALLTGPLEPTNEWYAVAKIAGIKLCQAYRQQHNCDFISAMPTNLYGPGDNYDLNSSHVIPAPIRKAHEAKLNGDPTMIVWGTGSPLREFMHVDDCADALVHIMKNYSANQHINVGCGEEFSIMDATKIVCEAVGYKGTLVNDLAKPDGTPRKLMCSARLRALGWSPKITLRDGLTQTYKSFLEVYASTTPTFETI